MAIQQEILMIGGYSPHDPTTTPTEKLDAILMLFEIKKGERPIYPDFHENAYLHYKKPKDIVLERYERDLIVKKLNKDGYIDMTMEMTGTSSANLPHYKINFNGLLFLLNGGYTQELKDKISLRQYRIDYDKMILKQSKWLNWGTWFLGGATVLLVIVEVIKEVLEYQKYYHYFFCFGN